MPKSRSLTYSPNVNRPSREASRAQACRIKRFARTGFSSLANQSAAPARTKPIAVFAFMLEKPGYILFSDSTPDIQPHNTRLPANNTPRPAYFEKDLNEEILR